MFLVGSQPATCPGLRGPVEAATEPGKRPGRADGRRDKGGATQLLPRTERLWDFFGRCIRLTLSERERKAAASTTRGPSPPEQNH